MLFAVTQQFDLKGMWDIPKKSQHIFPGFIVCLASYLTHNKQLNDK